MRRSTAMARMAACTALASATFALAMPAEAELLAYETFDYESATLAGQDGGFGWSTTWKSNAALTNDSTVPVLQENIAAPPNYVGEPTGGSVKSAPMAMWRGLAPSAQIDFGSDGEYYFSFLAIRNVSGTYSVFLHDGTTTVVTLTALTNGQSRVTLQGTDQVDGPPSIGYGTEHMWVVKIVTSADGPDQVFAQIYHAAQEDDLPVVEPETWMVASNTANLSSVVTQLFFGNGGTRELQLDEIRIGTNWADVAAVPEPASLALLSAGLLALVGRRRRA